MRYRVFVAVQDLAPQDEEWHIQDLIELATAATLQEASQMLARVWATADTHPREPEGVASA